MNQVNSFDTPYSFRKLNFTVEHIQKLQQIVVEYGNAVGVQLNATDGVKSAVAWQAFRTLETTAKTNKKCKTAAEYAAVRTMAQAANAIGASVEKLMQFDIEVLLLICQMDGRYSSHPQEALAQIVTESIAIRDNKDRSSSNNQAQSSGQAATQGFMDNLSPQQATTVDSSIALPQNNGNGEGSRAAQSFVM